MRINLTKVLGGLVAIFGLYTLITILITIFGLKSSPVQLYKSTIVKPEIIELTKTNIDTVDLDSVRFISAFTKEGIPVLFVRNSKDFYHIYNQSAMDELILQYASGSGNVFADHCPSRRYIHANCIGPIYNGDDLVQPRTCECVKI